MRMGIIGLGIVGSAIQFGMEYLGHEVKVHDIKLRTKLKQVLESDVCFLCVPTPKKDNGDCETSIVEGVIFDLINNNYEGIICIKSTVTIGTTQSLIEKYNNNLICFSPEFLRERNAKNDFTENQDLLVIGSENNDVFNKIKECHGHLPKKTVQLTPTEAEACKYMNNALGATLVTFANSFYKICQKYGVNYTNIQQAMMNREFFPKSYLTCNDRWLGWRGPCWVKDIPALSKMSEGTDVEFFKHLIDENEKCKQTVPEGMRFE